MEGLRPVRSSGKAAKKAGKTPQNGEVHKTAFFHARAGAFPATFVNHIWCKR
jgi:hypothetical protein